MEEEARSQYPRACLVMPENLLELLFRNAHPNAVGAVHHEYDGMDVAVQKSKQYNIHGVFAEETLRN